jgi:hypothetical protein
MLNKNNATVYSREIDGGKLIRGDWHKNAGLPMDEKQAITCLDFWVKKSDVADTLAEYCAMSAFIPATERATMLKMILGMAISAYGYKPWKKRNAASGANKGSIKVDLEKRRLSIDEDTIRKYLKEAAEMHLPVACTE